LESTMENLNIVITADVKKALSGLSSINTQLSKLSTTTGAKATKSINTVTKTAKSGTSSMLAGLSKLTIVIQTLRRAFDYLGKSIQESMDYGETINLFQTSMRALGKKAGDEFAFLGKAESFTSSLSESLSLDPDLMMNYQAIFAQMSSSMGVTESAAYDLSESFTMLGADIASLFNIDVESAYQKLQSALSGQARAMREFGVDISVATMQEKAYALGINKSVTAMTQAEKAQLRYIMIMEGLTVAQGDMARTLESPANQLRILSAQFVQLTRAIGNVFIPMVTAVLPYINAVVMGVKNLITSLAKLVGYEIPDFKATPVQIFDTEDATGEVDDVTESVKNLKKATLGIDELNIMSDNSSASAGATAGGSRIDLSAQIAEMNAAYKDMVAGITDSVGSKSTDILESWRVSFAEFKAAWGGECQKTLGIILNIFNNIGQSVANLWTGLKNAWNEAGNGTSIIQGVWDVFNELLLLVERIWGSTADWLGGLDWSPFMSSVAGAVSALQPLVSVLSNTLAWLYQTVLLPIATWTIEQAAPASIAAVTAALQMLSAFLEPFFAGFQQLWASLQPIVQWVESVVIVIIDSVRSVFEKLAAVFTEKGSKIQGIVSGIGDIISAVWVVIEPIFNTLRDLVGNVFEYVGNIISTTVGYIIDLFSGLINFVAGIFTGDWERAWGGIKEIFVGIWDYIKGIALSIWEYLKGIWNAIKENVESIWNGIKSFFSTIWGGIKDAASSIWNGIKNVVMGVVNGLKNGITTAFNAVKTFLTSCFNAIKNVATSVWNGIWGCIKGVINGILGGIEGMVNGVIKGLNFMINALNKLSFDVPDWVPIIGGEKFGFNIKNVSEVKIPRLADGGVLNSGQMFIAREAGPELVANLGRQTAVMNNDQIVESVSNGVAAANYEQNAILRELVYIGKKILEKDTVVNAVVSANNIIDGLERKNRRDGKTVIPVGY